MTPPFLSPLYERLDLMARGRRITEGRESYEWDLKGMHPLVQARQDAFHFDLTFEYPEDLSAPGFFASNDSAWEEVNELLKLLSPHPLYPSLYLLLHEGEPIRIELHSRLYRFKRHGLNTRREGGKCVADRVWLDPVYALTVRAWGLEPPQHDATKSITPQPEDSMKITLGYRYKQPQTYTVNFSGLIWLLAQATIWTALITATVMNYRGLTAAAADLGWLVAAGMSVAHMTTSPFKKFT